MFVRARAVCGTRICCSASARRSGVIQKIHMVEIEVDQGDASMSESADFMIWGRLTKPRGTFRCPWVRADAQCIFHMARRTCFREQYYTGTRGYNTAREDCRPGPGETIYVFVMVFHQYLRIGEFVWALVLCGTRYY